VPVAPKRTLVTVAEALARPESERVELIRGALVQKPAPTGEHARTQSSRSTPSSAPTPATTERYGEPAFAPAAPPLSSSTMRFAPYTLSSASTIAALCTATARFEASSNP
jgi:hypothetical protein